MLSISPNCSLKGLRDDYLGVCLVQKSIRKERKP